jgi:hypothetical protein
MDRAVIVELGVQYTKKSHKRGLVVAMLDDSPGHSADMWLVQKPPSENSVVIVR